MSEFKISDEEWNQRRLCSDGNCIGVIGPDGKCKECGLLHEDTVETATTPAEAPPESQETAPASEAKPATDTDAPGVSDATPAPSEEKLDEDDDWANRQLCPDGNCIGVIGPDGKCKECGKQG